MKWTLLLTLLALSATISWAQFNRPPIGPGSLGTIGPSVNAGGGGGGGGGTCTGALDLSTGCAQLVAFGVLF
jgi:hypothetical protein